MLHKLCNFGTSGTLLNWCAEYLFDRQLLMFIIYLGHQLRQGFPKALFWALSFLLSLLVIFQTVFAREIP